MKPSRALLAGLVAYVAFLVASVPAEMLARQAASATAGRVLLEGATGTVWSGSSRVSLAAHGLSIGIDEVRWRFLPSRLLAGRLAFLVEAGMDGLEARLELSRGPLAWEARDFRASADAAVLAALHPAASIWQPAGPVLAESSRLAWDGEKASGVATVEWRDASLALSPVRPLGSWRARVTGQGAGAKATLETLRGPLRLAGEATLLVPGRLVFSGEARAEPGHERDLAQLLGLMGPPRADGAHAVEIR